LLKQFLRRVSTSARFLARNWEARFLPEEVIFEVTTMCNLECPMCARTAHAASRPNALLEMDRFEALLSHIPDTVERIAIAGLGEPALNPKLPEMIQLLTGSGFKSVIYTNGTLLTELLSERLVIAGLGTVIIPVDGASPRIYEKYRKGGDLEQTTRNITALVEVKRRLKAPLFVELQMLMLPGTEQELAAWRRQWSIPGIDTLRYKPDHMQVRGAVLEDSRRNRGICPMPWRGPATVDIDGNVYPCCVQDPRNVVLGNLFEDPLTDIWNGDTAREMRRRFVQSGRKLDSCHGCEIPVPPALVSSLGNLLNPFLARRVLARAEFLLPFLRRGERR